MSEIEVGNAPCSWGTLEFASGQSDRFDCDQMLDELTEAGYTGSELGDWGFMPTEPEPLAEKFAQRGLSLTGAFVPVALRHGAAHDPGLKQCLRVASLLRKTAEILSATLDHTTEPFLVLADDNGTDPVRTQNAGRVEPDMALSADEWSVFASGADAIARAVRDGHGIRTVFHHHCAGFVETPGEIDSLLEETDPECLGLVFDTGHYAFGAGGCEGVAPALQRYASRIWYVHFKDVEPAVLESARRNGWNYFDAVRSGVFCELGDGCVDFPSVATWLRNEEYRGFVTVEQDVLPGMGTPFESACRDRAYLTEIGL